MIKEIMRVALKQQKHRNSYLNIWSWIYANTNAHNVYYGTMKEICEACQTDYAMVNRAFLIQNQWNTEAFEQTIILRKDDAQFKPVYNYHDAPKYFNLFGLNVSLLRSQYKPIIIVFNSTPYDQLQPPVATTSAILEDASTANKAGKKQVKNIRSKVDKALEKDHKEKMDKQLQNACLDVYIDFYKRQNNMPPKLNGTDSGREFNALHEMIRYFRSTPNCKTDIDVIAAFDLIFQNWSKYDAYYQKQYKLSQINSNLVNLIGFIKNNPQQVEKSKSSAGNEAMKKFNALMLAGAFKEQVNTLGN